MDDEVQITAHWGRLKGRFEVQDPSLQGPVVCLVKACGAAPELRLASRKEGESEHYLLSVLSVKHALPLAGTLREQAIVYMEHGSDQTYLTETGEVRLPFQDAEAVRQVDEMRQWLDDIGELREGESLVAAMKRLSGRVPIDVLLEVS